MYALVVLDIDVVKRFLCLPHRGERLFDLVRVGEHRNEQAYLSVAGGAEDRAKLGQKNLRLGKTEEDRAKTQGGGGAASGGPRVHVWWARGGQPDPEPGARDRHAGPVA